MRILIAGCGDVGNTLAEMLVANGHDVWGLRRNVIRLPEDVNPVKADLNDMASLTRIPHGLDLVFYTAAADERSEAGYRRAYVNGVANLLNLFKARGERPRRIFFTSSTSVFGQTDGSWVDETSETRPDNFTGQIILEGEQQLLESGYPATVVRLAGIYGPGRHHLINMVRRGRPCPKDPPEYTNRIHRDDCAAVMMHLMGVLDPENLYLAADDDPAPRHEVYTWLADKLGIPGPDPMVPGPPLSLGNKRVSNGRLIASGYHFRYRSFREGYEEILEELKS